MRVLSRAIVTACAIAAAFGGGACYQPSLEDCQFTCGPSNACPDGTACMDGYCRDTSTGACTQNGGMDAGTDGGQCLPSPCGAAAVPITGGCATLCTQVLSFADALEMCGSDTGATGTWHIAILDDPTKRTEFGQNLPMTVGWIGLEETAEIWRWLNASGELQSPTGSPWASGEPNPDPSNIYGLFDSTSDSDVFRTGGASDTRPFYCEYSQ